MNNGNAQKDKEQKLKFEGALLFGLTIFLNNVVKNIRLYQDEVHQLYHINDDRQALQSILTNHYMGVQDRFMKTELSRLKLKLSSSQMNNLRNILYQKASMRSVQQSGYMIGTMQKQLDELGIGQLKAWHKETQKRFSSVVVNVETQGTAEETKRDTIGFSISQGLFNQTKKITSMWFTILDGKERETHEVAHGQTRAYGEKFFVGQELLRYPGDHLGTMPNIAGCRCTLLTQTS